MIELTPTKILLMQDCPKCFYLQEHPNFKIKRPMEDAYPIVDKVKEEYIKEHQIKKEILSFEFETDHNSYMVSALFYNRNGEMCIFKSANTSLNDFIAVHVLVMANQRKGHFALDIIYTDDNYTSTTILDVDRLTLDLMKQGQDLIGKAVSMLDFPDYPLRDENCLFCKYIDKVVEKTL